MRFTYDFQNLIVLWHRPASIVLFEYTQITMHIMRLATNVL